MECNWKKILLTKVNLLSYALRIKSTLENLIKMLADPSRPTLLTIHNDRSEFVQQLGYNYIAFYDYGEYYYFVCSRELHNRESGFFHIFKMPLFHRITVLILYHRIHSITLCSHLSQRKWIECSTC